MVGLGHPLGAGPPCKLVEDGRPLQNQPGGPVTTASAVFNASVVGGPRLEAKTGLRNIAEWAKHVAGFRFGLMFEFSEKVEAQIDAPKLPRLA